MLLLKPVAVTTTIWNSADQGGSITVSGGGLTVTGGPGITGGNWSNIRSTTSKTSGKWHFELTDVVDGGGIWSGGIGNATCALVPGPPGLTDTKGASWQVGAAHVWYNGGSVISTATGTSGDVMAFELDVANNLLWYQNFTKATGWLGSGGTSGNPGAGTNGLSLTGINMPGGVFIIQGLGGNTAQATLNIGPTFSVAVSSGFSAWG